MFQNCRERFKGPAQIGPNCMERRVEGVVDLGEEKEEETRR